LFWEDQEKSCEGDHKEGTDPKGDSEEGIGDVDRTLIGKEKSSIQTSHPEDSSDGYSEKTAMNRGLWSSFEGCASHQCCEESADEIEQGESWSHEDV